MTIMAETWLLIDVNNLAHQVAHRGGRVKLEDMDPDEVRETLCRDMLEEYLRLKRSISAKHVVWCFDGDSRKLIRKQLLKDYKATRAKKEAEMVPAARAALDAIRYEIKRLRLGALPAAGFARILHTEGYEGDDHVAAACKLIRLERPADEVVIVSSDSDLYQLLQPQVYIHRQEGMFDVGDFRKKYGTWPRQWVYVKALAGCGTDDVPGVKGVALKTAVKYLEGTLPKHHQIFKTIESPPAVELFKSNLRLVRLPMAGCPDPALDILEDDVTQEKWARVCRKLNAPHLIRLAPITRHDNGKG